MSHLTQPQGRLVWFNAIEQAAALQLVRYFGVALLALLGDALVLSATARWTSLDLRWCVLAGFLVGALINYYLSIVFVFKHRRFQQRQTIELLAFVVIGVLGLFLTEITIHIGHSMLGWNLELTKLLAAGMTFFFNFILRKFLLFK